jgi:predicted deacetylase
MTNPRAVVSVHDATPAHEAALRSILALLTRHRVPRTSILVVPDYHRGWDLRRHPGFVRWLEELEAAGHEIVLHGLEHEDPTPSAGTPWQRAMRRLYSTEAEFYTLGYKDAMRRIHAGLDSLESLGFRPQGFVAPAWMHSGATLRAARDAGLRYVTTLDGLIDLQDRATVPARAVCFSSRSALRARVTTAYCALLARVTAHDPVVRIAIHPGDMSRPGIVACLDRILARTGAAREFVAYRDLLGAGA